MNEIFCAILMLFNWRGLPSECLLPTLPAGDDVNKDVQVSFLKSSDQNLKEITVSKKESNLTFVPLTETPDEEIRTEFDGKKDKVTIKNIHPEVDLEFIKTSVGVKENIILRKYTGQNEFWFRLNLNNLKVKQTPEHQWIFYDQDPEKPILAIPQPFMIDRDKNRTSGVSLSLVYKEKIPYFKIVADKDWLTALNRRFPVIIDPSIEEPEKSPKQEVKAGRTETGKTYSLGEGRYEKIVHVGKIHYRDRYGQFKEKDTNFQLVENDPVFAFQASFGDIKIKVKDKIDPTGYLYYEYNGKHFWQGIDPDQPGLGKMNTENPAVVENNVIIYPDIYPGMDLRYSFRLGEILEEFVVRDPGLLPKISELRQFWTKTNFSFIAQEDGSFREANVSIPKPVLYELNSQANRNYDLRYVTEVKNQKLYFDKVILPEGKQWLADSRRQFPLVIDTNIIENVIASNDDTSDYKLITDNDMYCVGKWSGAALRCGIRFQTVSVPNGADISSSHIQLSSSGNASNAVSTTIYGNDVDSCSDFSGGIPSTYTTAYTSWTPGSWTAGSNYDTPAIDTVIEEIIARAGWASNNNMCFVFVGGATSPDNNRLVRQYDYGPGYNEPELHFTYVLNPPSGVSATDGTYTDKVTVSWNAVTGATNYKIYRSDTCGSAKTYVATDAASPYDDTGAPAPSVSAPSSLSASTGTYWNNIRVTIGTAGTSNYTSRCYYVTTLWNSDTEESAYSTGDLGYRYYGAVTGYDFYYNGDSYTTPLATNQASPWDDTAAADATYSTPTLTASDGTSATYVTLDAANASVTNGASRTYEAKTRTSTGNLSALSAASNAGYTSDTVSNYNYQITDTSSSTNYGWLTSTGTDPYNWTGCSLGIHSWFRVSFNSTQGNTSGWSAASGGDEGWCATSAQNILRFDGVKIDGVKGG